jgi:hypothetical protein
MLLVNATKNKVGDYPHRAEMNENEQQFAINNLKRHTQQGSLTYRSSSLQREGFEAST